MKATGVTIAELHLLSSKELGYWLTHFIHEIRKKCGGEYTPNTLHHICCGLMRQLRLSGHPNIDFFKDPDFSEFRASLDAEMKRLQGDRIGSKKKQAEVFTSEEENKLWEMGLLGDASPQSLLDTMVFYNGFYFALCSGQEHRQLRRNTPQIELVERPGERAYLKYTEDISKNRPGGLKGRKASPKVVIHHANIEVPERCFVRLYKLYMKKCPSDAPGHAFYLRASATFTSECWYSRVPLGHTTLSKTVSRLCQLGGIQGFKTNHLLRATATTRLYQSGVDEQLVMERTGHQSLEGVRSYKRTSNTQREALSNILNQSKDLCQFSCFTPQDANYFHSTLYSISSSWCLVSVSNLPPFKIAQLTFTQVLLLLLSPETHLQPSVKGDAYLLTVIQTPISYCSCIHTHSMTSHIIPELVDVILCS